jgi:hypothetical protein
MAVCFPSRELYSAFTSPRHSHSHTESRNGCMVSLGICRRGNEYMVVNHDHVTQSWAYVISSRPSSEQRVTLHPHRHIHSPQTGETGAMVVTRFRSVLLKSDCGKEVRDHWPVARGRHPHSQDLGRCWWRSYGLACPGGWTASLGWRRRVSLPGILRNLIRDPATTPLTWRRTMGKYILHVGEL